MRLAGTLVALLIVAAGPAGALPASSPTPAAAPTPAVADGGVAPVSDPGAGVTASTAAGAGPAERTLRQDRAPPDPSADRLGWEAGYWYNESLSITVENGLNRSELRAIIARSAARVERIRQLEFERLPQFQFVNRSAYAGLFEDRLSGGNVTTPERLHQNTKFEALFMIAEDESYFRISAQNRGAFAAAFYTSSGIPQLNVSAGTIAIIVRGGQSPTGISESTLGHELTHALQHQQFGGRALNVSGPTEEAYRTNLSLVEGDATYVGQTYQLRCGTEWSCLSPPESSPSPPANFGLAIYQLAPYGTTGAFIDHVREERGWDGVNALYEPGSAPASTEQFIHPEKFPGDQPTDVTVEHRTADGWRVLDLPNSSVDYATFGEAGIFAMLIYPSYAAREEIIVPPSPRSDGALIRFNFRHPASDGWDGDKLYPYVNDTSAERNETGYVWKIVWDSPEDASEFLDAYRELLAFHDAERAGERTYRVPEPAFGRDFGDAFHLVADGNTTIVVNAPTVADLSKVRTDVTVEERASTTTTTAATATTTTTTAPTTTTTASTTTAATSTDGEGGGDTTPVAGPGFGPVALLGALAVLAAGLLARRRR